MNLVRQFLTNLSEADGWQLLSALLAILGLSITGLINTLGQLRTKRLRGETEKQDQAHFGESYEIWRSKALRDGCHSGDSMMSLRESILRKKAGLQKLVRTAETEALQDRLTRVAAGSSSIQNREFVMQGPLLIDSTVRPLGGGTPMCMSDIVEQLTKARPTVLRPTLLIGNAGEGKSLACTLVRHRLVGQAGPTWGLFISVGDFPVTSNTSAVTPGVGSNEWLARLVCHRIGLNTPTDLELSLVHDLIREDAVIILDAVDEIFQRLSRTDQTTLQASWVFRGAALVTTRLSHFHSALNGDPQLSRTAIVVIDPPAPNERQAFITAVCVRMYGTEATQRAATVEQRLTAMDDLNEVAESPLLLLMLCEVAHRLGNGTEQSQAVHIYGLWIRELVMKELANSYSEIASDDLMRLIEDVAWGATCRTTRTKAEASQLDRQTLEAAIQRKFPSTPESTRSRLQQLLVQSALLSAATASRSLRSTLAFKHESFAEFLVAARLNGWLVGDRSDGDDFFEILETPEITLFVKEYIVAIKGNSELRRRATQRLASLLDRLMVARIQAPDERIARLAVFSAGQVAYHLGMLADGAALAKVRSLAVEEKDFWIRRAAAIGLMFGGDVDPYHRLIDAMQDGLQKGDLTMGRQHIAIELGFYGDQEFNLLDPANDQGGSSCRRLVSRVAAESGMTVERPNWRLDFFDILYLWYHRPVCREDLLTTLREVAPHLHRAAVSLEAMPENQRFPEPRLLRELLAPLIKAPGA